jgi:membrane-bound lytic murein transglycosylase B
MGQSQFMPSSFLAFAVSFRGDGPPDIWNRREDVFASIANYLASSGWRRGKGWGEEVALPEGLVPPGDRRPVAGWTALGVTRVGGKPLTERAGDTALVLPAPPDGPAFLATDNFRVILKWNSSNYFAIAVGLLADNMKRL